MISADKKDLQIVEVLKKDSRTSIRDIARITGLKPSTVHLRIQNLVRKRLISYTVKIDPDLFGEQLEVFAYLVTDNVDIKEYNVHFIKKVMAVSGDYDTMLVMKFKDLQEYDSFFSKFKLTKGIKKTKTIIVTKKIKE